MIMIENHIMIGITVSKSESALFLVSMQTFFVLHSWIVSFESGKSASSQPV